MITLILTEQNTPALEVIGAGPGAPEQRRIVPLAPGWARQFTDLANPALWPERHATFVLDDAVVDQRLGFDRYNNERREQQDAAFVGHHLLAVADGVGGHADPRWAAEQAIEAVAVADIEGLPAGFAMGEANGRIEAWRQKNPDTLRPPAAALAVVDLRNGLVAWAGDVRVYAKRPGTCLQLTRDHGYPELGLCAAAGFLTPWQRWWWETTTIPTWARELVIISDGALKGDPSQPFNPELPTLPDRPRDNATLLVAQIRCVTIPEVESPAPTIDEADVLDAAEAAPETSAAGSTAAAAPPTFGRLPWCWEKPSAASSEVAR